MLNGHAICFWLKLHLRVSLPIYYVVIGYFFDRTIYYSLVVNNGHSFQTSIKNLMIKLSINRMSETYPKQDFRRYSNQSFYSFYFLYFKVFLVVYIAQGLI